MQRAAAVPTCLWWQGCAVWGLTGFLDAWGPQPSRISCLLQNLYIKSLWKVTPQWHRRRARALSSDGSGGIMHRNNPFMYSRYDSRLLKELGPGGWRGGSVLEESRNQVLGLVVFERWRLHTGGCLVLLMDILYFSTWGEQRSLQKPQNLPSPFPSLHNSFGFRPLFHRVSQSALIL